MRCAHKVAAPLRCPATGYSCVYAYKRKGCRCDDCRAWRRLAARVEYDHDLKAARDARYLSKPHKRLKRAMTATLRGSRTKLLKARLNVEIHP